MTPVTVVASFSAQWTVELRRQVCRETRIQGEGWEMQKLPVTDSSFSMWGSVRRPWVPTDGAPFFAEVTLSRCLLLVTRSPNAHSQPLHLQVCSFLLTPPSDTEAAAYIQHGSEMTQLSLAAWRVRASEIGIRGSDRATHSCMNVSSNGIHPLLFNACEEAQETQINPRTGGEKGNINYT